MPRITRTAVERRPARNHSVWIRGGLAACVSPVLVGLEEGRAAITCDYAVYARGVMNVDNGVSVNGHAVARNAGPGPNAIESCTGALATVSPDLALPNLFPGSFPVFTSRTDTSASTIISGNYGTIVVNSNTTTTFTGNIYSPFNLSDIRIPDHSLITGGIVTNGSLWLGDNTTVTHEADDIDSLTSLVPVMPTWQVPEPGVPLLFALGLSVGLVAARRRGA